MTLKFRIWIKRTVDWVYDSYIPDRRKWIPFIIAPTAINWWGGWTSLALFMLGYTLLLFASMRYRQNQWPWET